MNHPSKEPKEHLGKVADVALGRWMEWTQNGRAVTSNDKQIKQAHSKAAKSAKATKAAEAKSETFRNKYENLLIRNRLSNLS